MFATLSLTSLNRKAELTRECFCLDLQKSVARGDNIMQAILNKRVMSYFQEILLKYNIAFHYKIIFYGRNIENILKIRLNKAFD